MCQQPVPNVVSTDFPAEDIVIATATLTPPRNTNEDAAEILQQTIDRVADTGGGVVFLCSGHYPIRSRIILREGVILRGDWTPTDLENGTRGTILDVYVGRDEPDADPVFTMERGTGIRNLSMWYPEQRIEDPVPYAWLLRTSKTVAGDNTTVMNVTLVNPYQGIKIGPEGNELHTIRNVQMSPLKMGISIDSTTDIGRLNDVVISPAFWAQSKLPDAPGDARSQEQFGAYMKANTTGVDIGRSDWEYIYQVTVDSCAKGFVFRKGKRGVTNAVMFGCRTSRCAVGLETRHLNGVGLSATGCIFEATDTCFFTPETFSTTVQLNMCTFRGPVTDCVRLKGRGLVTFQNCTFSQWSGTALRAEQGMVAALGCELRDNRSHVELGSGMKRVRLLGNTFGGTPDIRNNATAADLQISHAGMHFERADITPHKESPFPRPKADRVLTATDFGMSADSADNGPALQNALDTVASQGGGTVYVPAGNYSFTTEITVPSGVELRGIFDVPHHTISAGSVLMPTCGKSEEDGTPFIRLSSGSGARGITVWYPEQHPAEPVPYPWTIRSVGPGCWLVDVTLGNAYQGADFWTHPSTGHVIRYLAGGMLRRGLWVSKCDGEGWVEDVQFNPHYALRLHKTLPHPKWDGRTGGLLIDYERENLEGMVFGRCQQEHMRGNFLYAAFDGIAFRNDDGGANARVFLHGTDTASRSATFEHVGATGVEFINPQLVPLGKWVQAAIVTTPTFTGNVQMFNTQIWAGPRTAQLEGSGSILIQQMNTLSGDILAAAGTLVLQNADFGKDLAPHVTARGKGTTAEVTCGMSRGGTFNLSGMDGAVVKARGNASSIPIPADTLPGPDSPPSNLNLDWETRNPAVIADTIAETGGGMRTVSNASCHVIESGQAKSGSHVLQLKGSADGKHSFIYFRILDGPFAVHADSVLKYSVFPVNDKGRHIAIDLHFTDGSTLRDSGIRGAHPGGPKGPAGAWKDCQLSLGSRLAGKTVEKIMCAYDSSGGAGKFEALFDDVELSSELGTGRPVQCEISPLPGTCPIGTQVTFGIPKGTQVRYTLNGLNPDASSPATSAPLVLDKKGLCELRTVLQREDGSLSPIIQSALYTVE